MNHINIEHAKKLNRIASGKEPKPDRLKMKMQEIEKRVPFLFFYTLWTFVENKQASTLTETQAKQKLEKYPKMEVYYFRLVNSTDRTPSILKGRKIEKNEISGHDELVKIIYQKTGAEVSEADLRVKENNQAGKRSDKPLGLRIRAFNADIAKAKRAEETKARILKCLQENDHKRRTECLKNCKH